MNVQVLAKPLNTAATCCKTLHHQQDIARLGFATSCRQRTAIAAHRTSGTNMEGHGKIVHIDGAQSWASMIALGPQAN
jgi:hypothetical protein